MQNKKRILNVRIKRMVDDSPDTSWLGEYANRATSEFSIDRAHAEDCASVLPSVQDAAKTLEHVQQTIGDMQEEYRTANHDREFIHDSEWDALEDAYNVVGELYETIDGCDCNERGDMERNEYRYFNPGSVEKFNPDNQWLAKYPAQERKDVWQKTMRQNAKSDYERMESLNRGDFCFIGIRAIADIALPLDRTYTLQTALGTRKEIATATQHITSGGLWGIESDSDDEYLESVEKEELSDLRTQLKTLGFSSRAISTAFKTVERTEE